MLIIEREREIKNIERGITELNEIFRDLGSIVNEQQGMLDNIESNILNTTENVGGANRELNKANEHQKNKRRSMFFIMLILGIGLVLIIVIGLS